MQSYHVWFNFYTTRTVPDFFVAYFKTTDPGAHIPGQFNSLARL
jgi:hypothetical protein